MTGLRSGEGIAEFWHHCQRQTEWQDHPVLQDPNVELKSLLIQKFKDSKVLVFGVFPVIDKLGGLLFSF